ncbi:MAG: radical SAM protein [Clostridia bacterium]|nr:radical SAM protein [Clostridia bacterium]
MKIGLIDVDGHNFPNLALMKLSAWHKARADDVSLWVGLEKYDRVFISKVFTFTPDIDSCIMADEVIYGGTSYDLKNKLPPDVETMCPDFTLYPQFKEAYGFLTRGCPRGCAFCCVGEKEGRVSRQVADLGQFHTGQKEIKLLDPNLLACSDHEKLLQQLINSKANVDFTQGLDIRLMTDKIVSMLNQVKVKEIHFAWDDIKQSAKILEGLKLYAKSATRKPHGHFGSVYVLTNFNTTHEQDLERIYKLRELNYDPYIMIYNKEHAPKRTRLLQRWVNNKIIYKSCERFEDYNCKIG